MDVFMLGCHAHTPSASILRHKVPEYRCLTDALWWDLGRWKLTKVSRDDSMAKNSVCRAKMDLTNVNMYTQQWLVTLDPHQVVVFNLGQLNSNHERAITHAHTWLSNYIMHLWECHMRRYAAHIQQHKYKNEAWVWILCTLHDIIVRCTCNFSCLTF